MTIAAPSDPLDLAHAADAFALPTDTLYLDCAAQAPRLHRVQAAGHAAIDADAAPWRETFERRDVALERLRGAFAATLFDGDSDGVAFVPSAAYGLATAARNLPLDAGDAVLMLDHEFPSDLQPWQQRCAETGARIAVVRRDPGQDWTDAALATLEAQPRARAAVLTQAHWHDGALLDLDRLAPRLRERGAALVLDLSQSLGALPVDLARWRPDFIVAVGFKWLLGTVGLACLWAASRWRDTGVPIAPHWSACDPTAVWRFDPQAAPPWRPGARRFDAGGLLETTRIAMAQAAIEQIEAWQVPRIAAALGERTAALDAALDAHGLHDWKTPGHAPHITALRPPPDRLDAAFDALRAERILCTRRAGVLRIAPHLHVDIDAMCRVAAIAAASM